MRLVDLGNARAVLRLGFERLTPALRALMAANFRRKPAVRLPDAGFTYQMGMLSPIVVVLRYPR